MLILPHDAYLDPNRLSLCFCIYRTYISPLQDNYSKSIFVLICIKATPVDRPQLGCIAKHANDW